MIVNECVVITATDKLDSVLAIRRIGNVASFGPNDPRWVSERRIDNVEESLIRRERYLFATGQIDKLLGA